MYIESSNPTAWRNEREKHITRVARRGGMYESAVMHMHEIERRLVRVWQLFEIEILMRREQPV